MGVSFIIQGIVIGNKMVKFITITLLLVVAAVAYGIPAHEEDNEDITLQDELEVGEPQKRYAVRHNNDRRRKTCNGNNCGCDGGKCWNPCSLGTCKTSNACEYNSHCHSKMKCTAACCVFFCD